MTLVFPASDRPLAGVDGCPAGWVMALAVPGAAPDIRVVGPFAAVVAAVGPAGLIAVDMPIGLPERIEGSGRVAEQAVRGLLGGRQSAVFAIPARGAIEAEQGPFADLAAMYDAHTRASALARSLSDPPRGISIQAFHLFPKIREIDTLLRDVPGLAGRVIESHPEVVFRRLNNAPLDTPKKLRGRPNPPGLAARVALLRAAGVPQALLETPPPRGAGADDLLDALACLVTAARHARGEAVPHPDPPGRDRFGLPVAIWA
jgi:predicted RNase H-like nuclease